MSLFTLLFMKKVTLATALLHVAYATYESTSIFLKKQKELALRKQYIGNICLKSISLQNYFKS